MKDLKVRKVKFRLVGEFLLELKKKFEKGDEESATLTELKKAEQGGKTMEEFVQGFKRIVRESRYKERALIEKFKSRMNGVIRRKLIEAERPPISIE